MLAVLLAFDYAHFSNSIRAFLMMNLTEKNHKIDPRVAVVVNAKTQECQVFPVDCRSGGFLGRSTSPIGLASNVPTMVSDLQCTRN